MVRLNQKVFTTYIILACLFIVVDLLMLISAESNKVKEFILADAIVLLPIVVMGLIYCKKDITEFKFNLLLGIDSILFCVLFLFIMYHQTSMYNIEKYRSIIVILMVLLFIIGGIWGYFRIGNNLYMEAGGGVVLGVSALGHLYAKYCIKNIKFTFIICLCAITYLIFFCIGYHFGSNYSA